MHCDYLNSQGMLISREMFRCMLVCIIRFQASFKSLFLCVDCIDDRFCYKEKISSLIKEARQNQKFKNNIEILIHSFS